MNIAKVFQSGSDQAIRLPDEFRVDVDEVYLKRTPEGFLVMPRDPWDVSSKGWKNSPTGSSIQAACNRLSEQRDWKP